MGAGDKSAEGSSPSPIHGDGWIGPGGRKFLAAGIALIALVAGAFAIAGGAEEIGDFFDELAAERGGEETTTLEDTTIESGEFPAPEPGAPAQPGPAPPPGTEEYVEDQFERAQRQLDCIARAPDAEAMAQCVQPSG
ncbi:MAG: hypothetical protein ACR2G3_05440 [Solirubrobacterales bacterium]